MVYASVSETTPYPGRLVLGQARILLLLRTYKERFSTRCCLDWCGNAVDCGCGGISGCE